MLKRIIAMALALLPAFGTLSACSNTGAPAGTDTQPTETKPLVQKDDGVLRVLLIGHSLGNDAMWMLPDVFAKEAPDTKVVLGFLYYSGCKLSAHVKYAQEEAAVYAYAEYDSQKDTYWQVAETNGNMKPLRHGGTLNAENLANGINQTSLFALKRQDWDVVVTQGYPWEVAKVSLPQYDPDLISNFNTLKQYVLDNDIDKDTTPKFCWNMVWTFPDDDTLIRDGDRDTLQTYFDNDVENYYNTTAQIVRDELMPELKFDYVFPSSTAYINALSGYKTTKDMYRDYGHASDFGRAMIAYLWYCTLTGTDITQCKLGPINYQYRKDELVYMMKEDMVLTEEEKQTIKEVVGNALAKPYEITPKA